MKKFYFIVLSIGITLGFSTMTVFGKNLFKKAKVLSSKTEKPNSQDILLNPLSSTSLAVSPSPILSPSPSPSPTLTPKPSPTLSPTLKPTAVPTPVPTPIPSPSPSKQPVFSSEEINSFIDQYAREYSVDPNILRHIAVCESGFNPLAENLYYAGLYQFSANTWSKYQILLNEDTNPDLRFNAKAAVKTAAYVLSINQEYIWPSCVP
ncbi:transglycosylase SLT domain-containing protein [Patescibacteria group bacterium]